MILVGNPDSFQQCETILDAPLRIIDKRAARRGYRTIDISLTAGADLGKGFLGGGIDNIDGGRGDRVNPCTVDVKLEMVTIDEMCREVSPFARLFSI